MDTAALKALSDCTRLKIVGYLSGRVYCVKALAQFLGLSESAVSQHMKVLRDAGLVEGVRYGYYTHYRLNRDALRSLSDAIATLADTQVKSDCDAKEMVGCAGRS